MNTIPVTTACCGRGAVSCSPRTKAWVLTATVLGSSLPFINGSVVNVALPVIQTALDASFLHAFRVVMLVAATLGVLGSLAAAFLIRPPERPDRAHTVEPSAPGCEECLALGATWVHLCICMTCGHVGRCAAQQVPLGCDLSQHKHARSHFPRTGYPIAKSFEPDEDRA